MAGTGSFTVHRTHHTPQGIATADAPPADIIECMATSDNVVRAGLTPKLRDVPTLVSMLTYEAGPGSKQLLRPEPWSKSSGGKSFLYDPPIAEFSVLRIALDKAQAQGQGQAQGEEEDKEGHEAVEGPSIVVVTEGKGIVSWGGGDASAKEDIGKGDVLFIGAGQKVSWSAFDGEGLEAYRAFVEA